MKEIKQYQIEKISHNNLTDVNPDQHHPAFTADDHALIDHSSIPGVASFDDNTISATKGWSSQKIHDEIQNTAGTTIDDNNIRTDATFSSSKIDSTYEKLSNKGQPNGYAPLNANGKIDSQYLQISVLTYKGTWDPVSGSYPTTSPNPQEYWWVSGSGTLDNVEYNVGDYLVYVDSNIGWSKIDNTERVTSVNGQAGAVSLGLDDLVDVDSSQAADGQVIMFNANNNKWINSYVPSSINDSVTATDTTWSSSKISQEIQNNSGAIIDDNVVATDKTWSSSKIQDTIDGGVSGIIDDLYTGTDKTWSSQKIFNGLASKAEIDDSNINTSTTYSSSKIDSTYEKLSNKNVANGYAGLDANAKIDPAQLPDGIGEGLKYEGTYEVNGDTNLPTPSGENVYWRIIGSGGTLKDPNNANFSLVIADGDLLIYTGESGFEWIRVNNVPGIRSVNGFYGPDVELYLQEIYGVYIENPTDLQVLSYDANSGEWLNYSLVDDSGNISTGTVFSSYYVDSNYQNRSEKGQPNGYCPLNTNGKIDSQYLQITSLTYKGEWDASTGNYPSDPNPQEYWYISNAGELGGVEYNQGDYLVYVDDTVQWSKIDNTERVTSVNGQTGDVNLYLDMLSDVQVSVPPDDNSMLKYNASTGAWVDIPFLINDSITSITTTYSSSKINSNFEKVSNKGVAEGYAPLDSNAKVPLSNLPDGTAKGLIYNGNFDAAAATDFPTTTIDNCYWVVINEGTVNGLFLKEDDLLIYNSAYGYRKVSGKQVVSSINGSWGDLELGTLQLSDVDPTNVYQSGDVLRYDGSKFIRYQLIDDTQATDDNIYSASKVSELVNDAYLTMAKKVSALNRIYGWGEVYNDNITFYFDFVNGSLIADGGLGTQAKPFKSLIDVLQFMENDNWTLLDYNLYFQMDSNTHSYSNSVVFKGFKSVGGKLFIEGLNIDASAFGAPPEYGIIGFINCDAVNITTTIDGTNANNVNSDAVNVINSQVSGELTVNYDSHINSIIISEGSISRFNVIFDSLPTDNEIFKLYDRDTLRVQLGSTQTSAIQPSKLLYGQNGYHIHIAYDDTQFDFTSTTLVTGTGISNYGTLILGTQQYIQ